MGTIEKSTILLEIRDAFKAGLQKRTSWGRNEVYAMYLEAMSSVLSKHATK